MWHATQKSVAVRARTRVRRAAVATACAAAALLSHAEEAASEKDAALESYLTAAQSFTSTSTEPAIAWQFGRACFDWAEFSTNDTQRAALAEEGIQACKKAIAADASLAPAHYYLGMNQGQLARTKGLGALKLVQEMEAHFRKARELDPDLDWGGPDRNLGLLYLEAPGWPVSVGNRNKARTHLVRAAELAPLFPENRLNLMEAYQRWKETGALQRELAAFDKTLPQARREFADDRWRWSWIRWENRHQTLRRQTPE